MCCGPKKVSQGESCLHSRPQLLKYSSTLGIVYCEEKGTGKGTSSTCCISKVRGLAVIHWSCKPWGVINSNPTGDFDS